MIERSEDAADKVGVAAKRTNLFAELRRRNVIRMAGLYLVGAWLLIQIAETLLPIFHTPAWVLQALVVLMALGLLPALLFSWVYELTPEGLKRDGEVDPTQSIAPRTARRMDLLTLVGMLLLLLVIAADRYWPRSESASGQNPATLDPSVAPDPARTTTTAAANSIAVLPFVNMSSDPEQEYFSDGISEEILNVLARVPELQVAARTSSFSFKGGKQEVPAIAEALNVRMVLEGSVRKQGERVRITAQLIDAQSGFHLWSETYDRELKDIFAIQDEIAAAIASALQVTLATSPADAAAAPRNLQAYDLYLRGLALWQTRKEGTSLWQAVDLFEQSLAIDPDNIDALTGLALTYAVLADYSERISVHDADILAIDYALRALLLNDQQPESYAVLGSVMDGQWRFEAAQALFQRAQALSPSYATAYQWLGTSLMASGQLDLALRSAERARVLDPRSPVIHHNLAQVLLALGRNQDAIAVCREALSFAPDYGFCQRTMAEGYLYAGDLAQAEAHYLRSAESIKPGSSALIARTFSALRGEANATAVAEELAGFTPRSVLEPASQNIFAEWQIAPLLLLLGHPDRALDYLEKFRQQGAQDGLSWALVLPALDPIRCEPRFQALVQAIRSFDPHFERVCAGKAE